MSQKIIIVEDEPEIINIICIVLESKNYELVCCSTIQLFRKELEKQIPDLVILDVMLPDGNGIDLCNEMKNHALYKSTPILLMSAHLGSKKLSESCTNAFIEKPFNIVDLRSTVDGLLAKDL